MINAEYLKTILTPKGSNRALLEGRMNRDKEFLSAYDPIAVLSKHNSFMLYEILHYLADAKGNIAEVGVWKGGSANLICYTLNKVDPEHLKKFYLFDVFDTPIENSYFENDDVGTNGSLYWNIPVATVKEKLSKYSTFTSFHPGLFDNTCGAIKGEKFSFVHIDCDYYKSVKKCCEILYPLVVNGGIMFIEDYGFHLTKGATRAADEYFSDKSDKPIICSTSGAIVAKGIAI